jgi:type IV secretory pathway VirB2 component (pilin)
LVKLLFCMFNSILKIIFTTISLSTLFLILFSSISVGAGPQTFNGNTGNGQPSPSANLSNRQSSDQNCAGVKTDLCYLQPSNIDCLFQDEQKRCKNPIFDIILEFLKQVAPYIATLIIVISGFEYFSDKNFKETNALGTLQAAVVGLVIILIGPLIATVITGTFSNTGKFDPKPLQKLLVQLVDFMINISTFAAVLIIVIGGYVYFTEGFSGDSKSSKGRNLIANGLIGLVVMLFARPVVSLLSATFSSTVDYRTVSNGVEFVGKIDYKEAPIAGFITTLLSSFLIPISAVVTVVFLVFGGYYWITSNGDDKRNKIALDLVKNAVIGLIVVLLSTTIVQLILYFVRPSEFIAQPTTGVTRPNTSANTNFPNGAGNTTSPTNP